MHYRRLIKKNMFISKKELLKRIVSLEDALGLKYVPADRSLNHSYEEHITGDYGFVKNTRESLKKLEEPTVIKK